MFDSSPNGMSTSSFQEILASKIKRVNAWRVADEFSASKGSYELDFILNYLAKRDKRASDAISDVNTIGGYQNWRNLITEISDLSAIVRSKGLNYLANQLDKLSDVSLIRKYIDNFEFAPDDVLNALNNANKKLFTKWKNGEIDGNPPTFKRYHYKSENTIDHSDMGDFKEPNNPYNSLESGKMEGGGHGQINRDYLDALGREYNDVYTFSNGVKTGNIPSHIELAKSSGTGQSWFPSEWTKQDIDNATQSIITNNQAAFDAWPDGDLPFFREYNGVRIGIIKTDGKHGTTFPDKNKQPHINGGIEENPF